MRILILGGTAEARELAGELVARGHKVTTSLAGRTSRPAMPAGALRVGKFGGVPGLVGYLKAMAFERLVDATHPYAGLISVNAAAAAVQAGIPLVRFMRPVWAEPTGVHWTHVPDMREAAAALPVGSRVLVTTGHEDLDLLLARNDCSFIVRLIEPPTEPLPGHARLRLDRPPYTADGERSLMGEERITALVTKNSGGEQTAAKLAAAAELGIAVIVIDRPAYGPATEVASIDAAIDALHLGT